MELIHSGKGIPPPLLCPAFSPLHLMQNGYDSVVGDNVKQVGHFHTLNYRKHNTHLRSLLIIYYVITLYYIYIFNKRTTEFRKPVTC